MRVLTFKAKPKTIFGGILLLTGIVVIVITFLGNHPAAATSGGARVDCSTHEARLQYIKDAGFDTDNQESKKEIIIPQQFNAVYKKYNEIQLQQGFNLERFKGKAATLYTYNITNYKDNKNVIADLIVCDGVLIGADLCDVSADDGFLVALNDKN